MKRNVRPAGDQVDVRKLFRDVQAVTFNYRAAKPEAPPRFGVIAEEMPPTLQRIAPDGKGGSSCRSASRTT